MVVHTFSPSSQEADLSTWGQSEFPEQQRLHREPSLEEQGKIKL